MRVLTLLTALVAIPCSASSEWVEAVPNAVEFRSGNFEELSPILYFGFSHLHGNMQSISGGVGYISCHPGRVDMFRLNIILETRIAAHLANTPAAFLMVHWERWPGETTVGSRTTRITSEVPEEFNAYAETPAQLDVVREFGPLGISDHEHLFASSYVDTSFVQTLADKDTLGLVYYSESEQRFMELFRIKLGLTDNQLRSFLTLCLDAN